MHAKHLELTKTRRPWTKEEGRQPRELYRHHSKKQIGELLNRTTYSIGSRPRVLKLFKHYWNPDEDEYIKRWYGKKGKSEVARTLGKKRDAVYRGAKSFGLTSPAHRRLTSREDLYMRREHRNNVPAALSKALETWTESPVSGNQSSNSTCIQRFSRPAGKEARGRTNTKA